MKYCHSLLNLFSLAALMMLGLSLFSSCKKSDDLETGGDIQLNFSADSLVFDTVFTTVGTATRTFMVYNPHDKRVKISSIRLAGGSASPFQINVDGNPSTFVENVEVDAKDSLYVFVRARIDPNNQNSPLVVSDEVIFETNGNVQDVDLVAWGQDAHYILADQQIGSIKYKIVAAENENITWTNDKPYVVYGWAVVDSTAQLNIDPGVNIHFHKGSGLWIYKDGCIKVNGTAEAPVTFQGDRLESYYDNLSGQWDRIWVNEGSRDNEFNWAVIKNGTIGIQAQTLDQGLGNKMALRNCRIENMDGFGLFSRFYQIEAGNTLVANCGVHAVYLSTGGHYDFRHCTIGNYWNGSIRQSPSLRLSNYYVEQTAQGNQVYLGDLQTAYFGNCIVYGNNQEELLMDAHPENAAQFEYHFESSLLRTELPLTDDHFEACIGNEDPLFKDAYQHHLELDTIISPAVNQGRIEVVNGAPMDLSLDLLQHNRREDGAPDMGAFEYYKEEE